jgi:tetratricopeptide (TPR) repeat protein
MDAPATLTKPPSGPTSAVFETLSFVGHATSLPTVGSVTLMRRTLFVESAEIEVISALSHESRTVVATASKHLRIGLNIISGYAPRSLGKRIPIFVALAMPDAPKLLEEGVRLERAGLLDRALDVLRSVVETSDNPDHISAALTHEADVHRAHCNWDESLRAARQAQEIARGAFLHQRVAEAVIAEANVHMSRGDFGDATLLLSMAAGEADPRIRGIAMQNLGTIHAQMGDLREAQNAFSQSLANFREAGYVRGEAIALNNFGRLAIDNGEADKAVPLLEQALQLGTEIEDVELAAMASINLAAALCCCGQLDRAQHLAMAALGYFSGCHNSFREIECLQLIGDINDKCEDRVNARRCYDLALRMADSIGAEVEQRVVKGKLDALIARAQSAGQPLETTA